MAPKIKSIETEGRFEDVITGSPEPIQEIARALRGLIAEVHPGVIEVPWRVQKNVGYGVGPKKMTEHFCYIMPFSTHVNLGFMQGTSLEDPRRLLEGTGKNLRHVKVRSLPQAGAPALRALIERASARLRA